MDLVKGDVMEAYQDSGLLPPDTAAGNERLKVRVTRHDAFGPHTLDARGRLGPLDDRVVVA